MAAVGCACTATWLAKRSHLLKLIDAPSRLLYIGKINSLRKVGTDVPVRVEVGSVKEALLAAALESDADVLMIGRSQQPGAHGRMRDLTYSMVRDSPFPVLSV